MQKLPAYKITHADLDRVTAVAARIFDRSISPQSRMEIIARSAGFNTYAAFLATLKDHPILLWGNQKTEESCAQQFKLDQKGIPYIEGVDLNAIISAGLAWGERTNIEGAMMSSPDTRLKALKDDGGRLADYLDFLDALKNDYVEAGRFAYRSSVTFEEARAPQHLLDYRSAISGNTVILVSPRNQVELGFDLNTGKSVFKKGGPWLGCHVHLSKHDQFFDLPKKTFEVDWSDPERVRRDIGDRPVICFDEADKEEIIDLAWEAKVVIWERLVSAVKAEALEIENEEEGDFFTLGYYGTARNDRPDDFRDLSKDRLADIALTWLCEIVNVSHGCAYEYRRMSGKPAPTHLERLLFRI